MSIQARISTVFTRKHPLLLALIGTGIAGLIMAALDLAFQQGGAMWDRFFTEPDALSYFCEESSRKALFRHKVNTYTNLGYLWAALWMLMVAVRDKRKGGQTYLRRHPEWSFLFGWACLLVFGGSTLFHAGLTRWTEWTDLAGVYAVALAIACLNLHRIQGLVRRKHTSAWPFVLLWLLLWIAACATIFQIKSWYLVIGAFLLIALGGWAILRLTHPGKSAWWFVLSMGATVLAVIFFVFDISRIGCDPRSWIQPHGLWHLCAATSFMLYYQFIRSSTANHAAL